MQYVAIALIAAATFGVCFLVDKGFGALFRNKRQHKSGNQVRHSKRYGSIGLILAILGLACLFVGGNLVMYIAGAALIALGVFLVGVYMSFGIYYDEGGFLWERFGKPRRFYTYGQIVSQHAYVAAGGIQVELFLEDGSVLSLQSGMTGVTEFLNRAAELWMKTKGLRKEDCGFYNPGEFSWFPGDKEDG